MSRGAGVAAVGALLCLLAGAFGTPALFVPGIALPLLAAGTWCWVRCAAWRVRLERTPETIVAEEGERLTLELVVRRPRLIWRGGELAPLPGSAFEALSPRRKGPLLLDVTAQRRGAHGLGPSLVRFRDPFGISSRSVSSSATELLVLPRPQRIAPAQIARIAEGPARGAVVADSWGEIDGLRAARPGARAARIHWPSVARTGTLLERRVAPESEQRPMIVLDARDPADEHALDMAVRATASLALAFGYHGGCSLLLPGERHPHCLDVQLRGWRQLHTRLALVQAGTVAWAQCARASPVVIVSAAATPRPPEVGRTAVQYLVSPFPGEEARILFEVAGCAVQALDRRLARAA